METHPEIPALERQKREGFVQPELDSRRKEDCLTNTHVYNNCLLRLLYNRAGDSSVVKSTHCFFRRLGSISRTHVVAHNCR